MELGKSFFDQGHPKEIRVITSSKERKRLTIILREARDAIINDYIVLLAILVESKNVDAVPAILFETFISTDNLIEMFLFSCYHAQSTEEPAVLKLPLDDSVAMDFVLRTHF